MQHELNNADNTIVKTIQKRLNLYLSKHEVTLPSTIRECNIDALAMEGSTFESTKLVKMVLIAALNSPRNSDIIKRIADLSTSTQEVVRNTIEESQQFSEPEGSDTGSSRSSMDHASLSGPAGVDELYHEEQLAKLTSERNKLANEYQAILRAHDEAEERAEQLEETNTLLQSRLERAEDQDGSSGLKVKHLQDNIKQKDGVIANLESRNDHLEQKINAERGEHEKTRVVAAKAQQYKDDFDEITVERDRLLRQANVANKYKQKLEATAALEKENVESRRQLDKLKHQLAESEAERRRLDGVAVNIGEYQDVLSRSEQELAELRDMNKRLKFDNTVSEQRCGVLEAERQEDQRSIQTLKTRLKTFDLSDSPDVESSNRDLDNELTNGEMTKQEAKQLESENEQLKSTNEDLQGRMKTLQATLDDLNRRNTLPDKKGANTAPNNKRRSSRLSSVSNADDIVSLEAFHDLKAALEEEKRLRAKAESELATSGENDSQSMYQCTLLRELQGFGVDQDVGHDHLSSLEEQQEDNLSQELSSTLQAIKIATRKQAESDDDKKILDQHIELLAEKVSESRLRLLSQKEVNVYPPTLSSSSFGSYNGSSARTSRFSMAASSIHSSIKSGSLEVASVPTSTDTSQHYDIEVLQGFSTNPKLATHFPSFIKSTTKGKAKA